MENKSIKFLPGTWKGYYQDVKGHRGQLTLDLESNGDAIKGAFELKLGEGTVSAYTLNGGIEGNVKGERINFNINIPGMEGAINYEARLSDAGSYALQCLYGEAASPDPKHFGGGLLIAWNFETKN